MAIGGKSVHFIAYFVPTTFGDHKREMEPNSKAPRKSLSLGNRINKRRSDTQIRLQTVTPKAEEKNDDPLRDASKSPSRHDGVEYTPPHKKLSLDESIEYSAFFFDTSLSPSALHSQTLGIGSPEVGWRWGKCKNTEDTATPDSAFESSFTSTESKNKEETQSKREEQLKALELRIRRAESNRADELLKQRCARFKEQLNEAESQRQTETRIKASSPLRRVASAPIVSSPPIAITEPEKANMATVPESVDDFFNDSDADGFLLEATEQVESEIFKLTQNSEEVIAVASTPTTISKEKRSSMYTKFLEDDTPDDWFGSLDDIIEKAMQQQKSRSSFQRFNSMPVEQMSPRTEKTVRSLDVIKTPRQQSDYRADSSKMKRHASSHDMPFKHTANCKSKKIG